MFTHIKMSAEEFNCQLSEGQNFSIIIPNDNFEISLLYKVLIDELNLMFEGEDYDKFNMLCNYIWYDSGGRFFFDFSGDPRYTDDKLSFYIVVFSLDEFEFEDEDEEKLEVQDLVFYDAIKEEETQNTVDREYEFYVYSHYKGLMKIELAEAIDMMMSNPIQKI
jgi:hypothetical protein